MKIRIKYLLIIFIALTLVCSKMPESISTGVWNYKLLVNRSEVGSATMSNKIVNNNYVSTTELKMRTGEVTNISNQIVTETMNFKPVKIENYNKIIQGDKTQSIDTIAIFKGNNVELTVNNNKSTIAITKDFVLDGNYFLARLIREKFKPKMEIEAYIYDPSIEIDEPILLKVKVVGGKNIEIKGKKFSVMHITESIESIKSIDMYIDGDGVLLKAVIDMLNMNIELIRE
jgi:hypothetical protein